MGQHTRDRTTRLCLANAAEARIKDAAKPITIDNVRRENGVELAVRELDANDIALWIIELEDERDLLSEALEEMRANGECNG